MYGHPTLLQAYLNYQFASPTEANEHPRILSSYIKVTFIARYPLEIKLCCNKRNGMCKIRRIVRWREWIQLIVIQTQSAIKREWIKEGIQCHLQAVWALGISLDGHRKVVFTDFVWVINRINNHQNIQGGDYWVTNKSDMSWIRLVLIYGTAQIRQKHHLAFDTNSIKLISTSTLMIQFCTNVRIQYSHRTLHYSGKHQNTALNKTSKSLCFFSRG